MWQAGFGEDIPYDDFLIKVVRSTPKVCATDAKLWMLHQYETQFGIHNHDLNDDVTNPLALIGMHRAEDSLETSPLYERIKQFHECDVFRTFGVSLKEFLDMPRYINSYILELSGKRLKEKVDTQQKEMKNILSATDDHPLDS